MYVFSKKRGVRKLKETITLLEYQEEYPDAIECFPPTTNEIEAMVYEGMCETPCGCIVELDGYCPHNNPSWCIILGVV